jgi:hypothetical protein
MDCNTELNAKLSPPCAGPTPDPDPRAWLDQFPHSRRGPIADWVHQAARSGAQAPENVLRHVRETLARGAQWRPHPDAAMVLRALQADRKGALTYAQHVINYEQLSYGQRQRVKAERSLMFVKQSMVGKDMTSAQRNYLLALERPD